jgi:hypothetical protein
VANTDTPLKEILDKYQDDEDTLRHILMAKVEEDKVSKSGYMKHSAVAVEGFATLEKDLV